MKTIEVIIQNDGLTAKDKAGTTFEIESVENSLKETFSVKCYQLQRISGTSETAEVLENGKLKLLHRN